jgi:hypothetical protein
LNISESDDSEDENQPGTSAAMFKKDQLKRSKGGRPPKPESSIENLNKQLEMIPKKTKEYRKLRGRISAKEYQEKKKKKENALHHARMEEISRRERNKRKLKILLSLTNELEELLKKKKKK